MRALAVLALLSGPALAQEPEFVHCYVQNDPPAGAQVSTASPPPLEGFGDYLTVALVANACGGDASRHQAATMALVARAECSPQSEVSLYALTLMGSDTDFLREKFMQQFDMDEARFGQWCERLQACAPGVDGTYDDACYAALKSARD